MRNIFHDFIGRTILPYSNRLLKLASLLLVSCLFTTSISPSFAADRVASPLTPQQIADVYGLGRLSASDEISESEPISRADFLRLGDAFFSRTGRTIIAEFLGVEANKTMHDVAITYLLTQVDSLQIETDQLIVEATRRGQRSEPRQAHSFRRPGHLLRSHSKAFYSKPSLRVKQLTPDAPVADYDSALAQLSRFGIDLRQPDGSFAPDQLLTQSDYLRHLRQIDVALIEANYGTSSDIESMVTVDVAQSGGMVEVSVANDRLTNVLSEIAHVKALIYRLQDLVGNLSVRKSFKADRKVAAGHPSSKTLQLAQAASAMSEETWVTQGEFALYMAEKLDQLPGGEARFITDVQAESQEWYYFTLQQDLALVVEKLENAITQLN